MIPKFHRGGTWREHLAPAMEIVDAVQATEYLRQYVAWMVGENGKSEAENIKIAHNNVWYYALHYDRKTQARVGRLFGSSALAEAVR